MSAESHGPTETMPMAVEAAEAILLAAAHGDSPQALAPHMVERLTPHIRRWVCQELATALHAQADLQASPGKRAHVQEAAEFVERFGTGGEDG